MTPLLNLGLSGSFGPQEKFAQSAGIPRQDLFLLRTFGIALYNLSGVPVHFHWPPPTQ